MLPSHTKLEKLLCLSWIAGKEKRSLLFSEIDIGWSWKTTVYSSWCNQVRQSHYCRTTVRRIEENRSNKKRSTGWMTQGVLIRKGIQKTSSQTKFTITKYLSKRNTTNCIQTQTSPKRSIETKASSQWSTSKKAKNSNRTPTLLWPISYIPEGKHTNQKKRKILLS